MSRTALILGALLLIVQVPSTVAQSHGPAIEEADPAPGAYTLAAPGRFPVEVECGDDPQGDDVFVDFIANGQVVEVDEDFWGVSPSYSFSLGQSGTHTLQARCRDEGGATGSSATVTWTVQVGGPAGGSDGTTGAPPPSGTTYFEDVSPQPGAYALQGVSRFQVEVECSSNNGVSVDFLVDGKVVETDRDIFGLSPSYSFFVVESGTHVLAAQCRNAAGSSAPVEWTVTVPRPSATAALLPEADGCVQLADPDFFPESAGRPGEVRGLLLANADVWHRTGPWTCELGRLAEPVALAYDIDSTLVAVKQELDSWELLEYSAWDLVEDLAPGVVPLWGFFEALLPILEACATALGALDAFEDMRASAILFLTEPSDAQLEALEAAVLAVMPAYEAWVAAFETAAAEVARLAAYLRDVAQAFLSAAAEADLAWAKEGLAFLGTLVEDWASRVQQLAQGIDALADPVRADLRVMDAILHPPSADAPAPTLAWLILGLAVSALVARRRRQMR